MPEYTNDWTVEDYHKECYNKNLEYLFIYIRVIFKFN